MSESTNMKNCKNRTSEERGALVINWLEDKLENEISLEKAAEVSEVSSGALRGYRTSALAGKYGKKIKKRVKKLHKKVSAQKITRVRKPKAAAKALKSESLEFDYEKFADLVAKKLAKKLKN